MKVSTNNLVSITDANQNFSKIARKVDEEGPVVILKNNEPKYFLLEFSSADQDQEATDEDLLEVSQRLRTEKPMKS